MTKKVSEIQSAYDQYQTVASVENALTLINAVQKKTVEVVLSTLKKDELQIYALSVFGSEDVFIKYLFTRPRALGYKMPIEFLVDDNGYKL